MEKTKETAIEPIRTIESDLTVMGEAIGWLEKGVVNERMITSLREHWKSICDNIDEIKYDI